MYYKISKEKLVLVIILVLGAFFRLYNINWDSGYQMHPDERAIVMAVDKLEFPNNINEFFSPQSSWNPKFFAYGSFPMYLLRVTGSAMSTINPSYGNYTSLNIVGRHLSAIFDLLTVFLIYKITRKLFNATTGLFAAFFYSISVLPIQLSHFYAVDTILTLFILVALYQLLKFYENPTFGKAALVGLFFGLALATKISASVLVTSIAIALIADFLLIFLKNPHRPKHYLPHLPKSIKHLLRYGFLIGLSALFTFIFFEPYALIDFNTFWLQTIQQSELTVNPFYFPYTLQFVGKIPYFYELKNVFLWGLGPALGVLSFAGGIFFLVSIFKKPVIPDHDRGSRQSNNSKALDSRFHGNDKLKNQKLIILIFFLSYFLVVGRFAVGFMRYMLPLYPIFAIFAGLVSYKTITHIKSEPLRIVIGYLLLVICFVWPLSFMRIYSQPNTRITASSWIYDNIPPGKTLAIEHWDDQLPMGRGIFYNTQTLKLYEPDTNEKWEELNYQLAQSDYIILASNRLHTPIQKLTDCKKLPQYRCYPRTSEYYEKLFSGSLGFQKVAEFNSYPTIPIANLQINDQSADENFTVFDHPKIMIFKKITFSGYEKI